eukprot:5684-Pelagococcus_subviridis.AAC.5
MKRSLREFRESTRRTMNVITRAIIRRQVNDRTPRTSSRRGLRRPRVESPPPTTPAAIAAAGRRTRDRTQTRAPIRRRPAASRSPGAPPPSAP